MVLEPVLCPACGTDNVVKHSRSKVGKQRYKCRNSECNRSTFMRDYIDRGYLPDVKQQIVDMAVNGSGIRDTAHVLKISPTTVIERKHLTLRTRIKRLARKTICFSKSIWLHDVVIGLFTIRLRRSEALRYEFGLDI